MPDIIFWDHYLYIMDHMGAYGPGPWGRFAAGPGQDLGPAENSSAFFNMYGFLGCAKKNRHELLCRYPAE